MSISSLITVVIVFIVLILVHEFGHFVAAKLSGMRVDEFGIGFPPRALLIGKVGETEYTLNWIPFGGFVKIYGENGEEEQMVGAVNSRSFSKRPRLLQAFVLVAGVTMNLIFAYILITGALIAGTPRALSDSDLAIARNVELAVANVRTHSPAEKAGIVAGDSILSAKNSLGEWRFSPLGTTTQKSFSTFIHASEGREVSLEIKHNGTVRTITAIPAQGIASDAKRYALGVEIAPIGVLPLSIGSAIVEGGSLTWGVIVLTAKGLAHFFYGILTFSADLSQVAGPIGIAGVVGSASTQGFGDLLSITAIISVSLALVNLIPIPATDGGRLVFVIIESVIRRPIKAGVTQVINTISFALLILLIIVVTAHDIFKIIR